MQEQAASCGHPAVSPHWPPPSPPHYLPPPLLCPKHGKPVPHRAQDTPEKEAERNGGVAACGTAKPGPGRDTKEIMKEKRERAIFIVSISAFLAVQQLYILVCVFLDS